MTPKLKAITLVELLITTSIFAVIAVTIYSSFHTGIFGYKDIDNKINYYQTARQALGLLNSDLRNAFGYAQEESRFSGSAAGLSFLTTINAFRDGSKISEFAFVSYQLEDNRLMRLCRKNSDALNEKSPAEAEEICAGLENFVLSYFYIDPVDSALKEKSSWDDPKTIPAGVKISFNTAGNAQEQFERTIFLP